MKSCFNGINIFLLYIIISFKNVISLLDFNYPSAISLPNKNIFIVKKNGIFVYDRQLENITYSYLFEDESDIINDSDKLSKVVIKLKANYIICLINRKIYFFDQEGKKLLLKTGIIINDADYYYPALIPLEHLITQNNYYYIIAYLFSSSNSYKLKLIFNYINTNSPSNFNINAITLDKMKDKPILGISSTYDFHNMGLSCEYMQCENKDDDDYNYLVCFYIIKDDDKLCLSNSYFKISSNSLEMKNDFKAAFLKDISNVVQIHSVPKEDRRNSFICLLYSNGNLKCYKFHYVQNNWVDDVEFLEEINTNFNCKNVAYGLKLDHLTDSEKISLSCINSESYIQVQILNKEFKPLNSFTQFIQCGEINSIYGHSIIQLDSTFYIISDIKCDNYKRN